MKNSFYALLLSLLASTSVMSQGIEFFHGSWEDALMKAKFENKIIFVDAYTTWCGPCKNMAANTFTVAEVGDYYNATFVNLKIDMEKEMGLAFRKKFPVTAYPTLFFIDADENVILKSVGGKGPVDFLKMGESVSGKFDRSKKYETAYLAGDRSYQLVYDYVAALNKAGKPSVKIANDYLAEQNDLTSEENLKFILEAASQVDCKCFELLEKYKSQIRKATSDEVVNEKIRQACANTVKRAIEFETPDLLVTASDAMKRNIPAEAEEFHSRSAVNYALGLHDMDRIGELVNHHVKKYVKNDPTELHQLALDLSKYGADNKVCMDLAVSLAEKAAKDEDPKYIATYAQLVHKSGDKQQALTILETALSKYAESDESKEVKHLRGLKKKIENG